MIKINNLNKYFFKGRSNEIHVINDVSIELPEKGIVTFFGKSGCGKTTLLNTLGGLDDFKSGSIEIDGHDINKKTDYVRNKYIGYIFQNYNLNLKVNNYENVAEALRLCGMTDENVIKERVEAALTNVGLEKFIYRMPDTLSGGQKQRVAIARAIVKNPKIILADEPTGNLDEANTVMIMDLLKSISEDHLVLLVTHEANLVDYYCDKVIELADGKIQKVYDNENANGYVAKDKNVIYLGEYEKREASAGGATLICYGEDMPEDIQIQLVNQDGKLCVKINSPKVKVVDENSEIEFREGVFEAEKTENRLSTNLDMSKLPEFEGKNYGRLFNFKTALKEGWNSISANKKKSNKALRNALLFFAILITLMVGIDAVGINKYIEKKQSVNYNTYTAFAVDNEYVKMLYESVEKGEHGIDYVRPVNGDVNVVYENRTDIFESFNYQSKAVFFDFINPIKSQGVLLPERLAINKKVLAGKSSDLGDKELVISRSSADYLLENVKYNFVKNYEDLIGLPLENYRIAGVVDTDENAFYVNEFNLINDVKLDGIYYDKKSDEVIEPGKTVATINKNSSLSVKEGDTVELYGLTLTVSKVKEVKASFTEEDIQWLIDDGMPDSIDSAGGEIMAVYGDEWGSWAMSITDSQYEAYKYVRQYGFEIKDSITYQVCQEDYIKAVDNKNSELSNVYMVVHSSNLEYTEGFLNTKFEKQKLPQGIEKAVISPISRIQADLDEIEMDLFDSCMTLFGFLVVLCFCVYMIMRSSVMSRIKEIGIYRSIGVTKKNLIFCYFVESVLLTTISVLPGFLIVVGITNYMKYVVGVTLAIFLPWWICLGLLALFYFVCVGCGILPAIILMNSTPSQIMAKYDV